MDIQPYKTYLIHIQIDRDLSEEEKQFFIDRHHDFEEENDFPIPKITFPEPSTIVIYSDDEEGVWNQEYNIWLEEHWHCQGTVTVFKQHSFEGV